MYFSIELNSASNTYCSHNNTCICQTFLKIFFFSCRTYTTFNFCQPCQYSVCPLLHHLSSTCSRDQKPIILWLSVTHRLRNGDFRKEMDKWAKIGGQKPKHWKPIKKTLKTQDIYCQFLNTEYHSLYNMCCKIQFKNIWILVQ